MRNKLPLAVTTVVGLGLFITSAIQPQQSAGNKSQNDDLPTKPCALVIGAVRSPARFVLKRPLRLAEAIEMAGGASDQALETIEVIHATAVNCNQQQDQGVIGCIDCRTTVIQPPPARDFYLLSQLHTEDEKANPYLQPGDMILIVEQLPVYVVGSVLAPQGIHLKAKMTLTQAIAIAGGVLRDSNVKKVRIFRNKFDSTPQEIIVDLNLIKKGRGEDLILEPYDIIEVPPKRSVHRNPLFGSVAFHWSQLSLRVIK